MVWLIQFFIFNESSIWLTRFSSPLLGNVVGIIGLLFSVVGIAYTIIQVRKAVSSSEAAKTASQETLREVSKIDAIIEFSSVITLMEEIKRHHRGGNYQILPDCYSSVRQKLAKIRSSYSVLNLETQSRLQEAISQFRTMEDSIEKQLAKKKFTLQVANTNGIISDEIDFLNELLVEIKNNRQEE